MSAFAKLDRHADLVTRMADTLGQDLETEMFSGRLTPDTMRELVFRCVSCRQAEDCTVWLNAQNGTADEAPEYCRNLAFFGAI